MCGRQMSCCLVWLSSVRVDEWSGYFQPERVSHNWADDIWDEPHEKGANALDPAEPIWQLENKLPVENSAISAHVTAVSISLTFIHATAAWTFSRRQWLKMFTQHFLPVYDCLFFFLVLCAKPKFEQYS